MPRHKLARPVYRLRLRGRTYVIDWTDEESGNTRTVSTGQRELVEAETWRDQWVAGREQPLPPVQPTIAKLLDGYLAARTPKVAAPETLKWSAKQINKYVGNLEPQMLASDTYSKRRSEDGVSDGTIRREVGALRAALAWAQREKWIAEVPYVEMPSQPEPRNRWLTQQEVDDLIRAASSPHVRLFMVLAYHTAARAGAILELTWDRVDFERKVISYDRPGRQRNKKRRAVVPINAPALAELQAARMVRVSDHVIEFRGKPVGSIKSGFLAACRRARIAQCSPHVLRHSAATHMVEARVPMVDIARMLGDTVAMVEKVYGKHSPDFLRNAADALAGKINPTPVGFISRATR